MIKDIENFQNEFFSLALTEPESHRIAVVFNVNDLDGTPPSFAGKMLHVDACTKFDEKTALWWLTNSWRPWNHNITICCHRTLSFARCKANMRWIDPLSLGNSTMFDAFRDRPNLILALADEN